jgi:hypothetical protein
MLSILIHLTSSFVLDVESVHLRAPNMSNENISQLATIKVQVMAWRRHNRLLICRGFFVVNDGLFVEMVKLQVLQCIICRFEQKLPTCIGELNAFQNLNLLNCSKLQELPPCIGQLSAFQNLHLSRYSSL